MQLHEALKTLAHSTAMEPVLIQFDDDAELMIVPCPHLTDVSWHHRGREYKELVTRSALLSSWAENDDPATISDETYRHIAHAMTYF